MFLCVNPAEDTVAFYRKMGCTEAKLFIESWMQEEPDAYYMEAELWNHSMRKHSNSCRHLSRQLLYSDILANALCGCTVQPASLEWVLWQTETAGLLADMIALGKLLFCEDAFCAIRTWGFY